VKFSETCGAFAAAMSKAQNEFKPIIKDSNNPFYNSKYADLANVIEATRPALAKYELSVVQSISTDLEHMAVTVTTRVMHSSGEWAEDSLEVPGVGEGKDRSIKFTVQTIGSASTYARRYHYKAMVGVAEEDDDGNTGGNHVPKTTAKPERDYEHPAQVAGDGTVTCHVLNVGKKIDKKGKEFLVVKTREPIADGKFSLFCYHVSLWEALGLSVGEDCVLRLSKSNPAFPSVEDVKQVGTRKFKDGKPEGGSDDALYPADDDSLPF
jgi:hypothetical protein